VAYGFVVYEPVSETTLDPGCLAETAKEISI